MSFLYLEGYKKNDLDSFFTLYDILHLAKPNVVAIPTSEKQYQEEYAEMTMQPRFEEHMQRAEYFAKLHSDELTTIKGILKGKYPFFNKKNRFENRLA